MPPVAAYNEPLQYLALPDTAFLEPFEAVDLTKAAVAKETRRQAGRSPLYASVWCMVYDVWICHVCTMYDARCISFCIWHEL